MQEGVVRGGWIITLPVLLDAHASMVDDTRVMIVLAALFDTRRG